MRFVPVVALCIAFATSVYAATPADAPVLHSTRADNGKTEMAAAPTLVQPGQSFTITGDCLTNIDSPEDVRVVLSFDRSNSTPGYGAVLATDQNVSPQGLAVRTPTTPDIGARVMDVRVFRVDSPQTEMCTAGRIRVGADIG